MPTCAKIRGKKRQVCIGDMDKLITLQSRDLTPAGDDSALEDFQDIGSPVWAMIETVKGEVFFDDVSGEKTSTHQFTIRWQDNISAQTWIAFEDHRYDILNVEDYDERHQFLLLTTSNQGLQTKRAADA